MSGFTAREAAARVVRAATSRPSSALGASRADLEAERRRRWAAVIDACKAALETSRIVFAEPDDDWLNAAIRHAQTKLDGAEVSR